MQPDLHVRVEFMGPFESDFGDVNTHVILTSPATITTLLGALASRWPAAERLRSVLCNEASQQRRYCTVSLDYEMLAPETVLDTPLHDGARVCFGTPMVGG